MISKDDKLLSSLQALCSRKEYCSSDMYKKALKGLEGDEEAAAQMLSLLVKDRFVDDLRYASAFARDKACLDGWGPVKIRFQLRGKGISDVDITEALAQIDAGKAREKLTKLLETKAHSLQGDPQIKLKLIKFALTRGYEYGDVSAAVEEML